MSKTKDSVARTTLINANNIRGKLAHALQHILHCDTGTTLCKDCERLAKMALESDKSNVARDEYGYYED